ncbi:MAG: hypothetical protein K0U64_02370, partial [Actinomycetia bacterium]|nr:hypothetical protein [Actinomycetes bacterium]
MGFHPPAGFAGLAGAQFGCRRSAALRPQGSTLTQLVGTDFGLVGTVRKDGWVSPMTNGQRRPWHDAWVSEPETPTKSRAGLILGFLVLAQFLMTLD